MNMVEQGKIFLGAYDGADQNQKNGEYLWLKYANRHGLVTGATGTGKTITLQVLAESFSTQGVPVFCADVKGDLSGIAKAGTKSEKITQRASDVGLNDMVMQASPVVFWDIFGELGHPIRATISEMGALLLSRLLNLTAAQEGALNIAFKIADDEGLVLKDLSDLRAMLNYLSQESKDVSARYGNVSKASLGAIQRELLVLETQGGELFFGEPALRLADIMRSQIDGRGFVNVLAAEKLMNNPRLYSTFLLWLMSELFKKLPEIGDPEKPRLVFFFDEAHLLFDNAPKALVDRIEQVVRLIRSKGVGIYFISQSPADIPESVLAQLGNRIQHALRAYTPNEMKAVKIAAQSFRPNPRFDTFNVISNLATGEALISTLEEKGVPSVVERVVMRPPVSQIGPISLQERQNLIAQSPVYGQYEQENHDETTRRRLDQMMQAGEQQQQQQSRQTQRAPRASNRQSVGEAAIKSATRSAANALGRTIVRAATQYLKRFFK